MNFTRENTVGVSDEKLAELNDEFNQRIETTDGGVVDYESRIAIFAAFAAEVARKYTTFGTVHAEVNDFVRKDGQLVRVMAVDVSEGCYFTSDGGLIGFDEVDEDNVYLESEVYDELGGRIPDAVETQAD